MNSQNRAFKEKYGPWALVTGASSGLGEEFARQLAATGLNLVLAARRKEILDQKAAELQNKYGVQVRTVQADLSEPEGIKAIEEATQGLEIGMLISNAGVGLPGAFLKNNLVSESKLIHLNATAHMHLAHLFGQQMSQRGRGGIILVSSIGAYQGMPFMANYSATKAYILNLGEALYFELKKKGVDVTVLLPGATRTEAENWDGMEGMSKLPMPWMQVGPVVKTALNALGKKPSIVPGGINKVMTFVGARMMSRAGAASMFGGMMEKAISKDRL